MIAMNKSMIEINKIYNGDCMDIMKNIDEKSIDIILTDPPYFLPAKHYETRKFFKRSFADLGFVEGFFKIVFEEFDRILKDDGLLYMFCDGQSYPLFYYYAYFIHKSVRPIIWDKKVSINGYYWRHQHEIILFGVRKDSKKIPTGNGDILRYNAVKVNDRIHPAQKPVELIKYILENTAPINGLILDPFSGVGTTAVACSELNLNYICIEKDLEYYNSSLERINKINA